MRKTMSAAITAVTGVLLFIGWVVLAVLFKVALPDEWQTDTAIVSVVALGLAWLVLVLSVAPFFASKYSIGGSAPMKALRLGSAFTYAVAVFMVTMYFGLPVRPFPVRLLIGIHAVMLGVMLVAMVVTSLIDLKAMQVSSEEETQRLGLSDIKRSISDMEFDLGSMGAGYAEMRAGVSRISEKLRYTSSSDKPEAAASEERLLVSAQRLRDSLNFQKALQTQAGQPSTGPQQDEMKRVITDMENEAVRRSRLTS